MLYTRSLAVVEDLKMEPERPFSKEQEIDGQTCSNGSMGCDTHLPQEPSHTWYPRRWTGWNSFRGNNVTQDKPVCRDFLRGGCAWGKFCKYQHSEPDSQEGYKFQVCRDFVEGRCNRISCKFLHTDSEKSTGCESNGNDNSDAAANSGKPQFYRENMDNDSRAIPFYREPRSRSPCRKFLKGMCYHGESCRYLHSEYKMYDRPRYDHGTNLQQGVATTSRNPEFDVGRIDNIPQTSQEREEGNEGSDIGTRLFSGEHGKKSPCCNFLRGRCFRGSGCPYDHISTYLRHRSDGTPPWRQRLETTSKIPDFDEGSRDTTAMASTGHEEANVGDVRSTHSLSSSSRLRSPCRNFARGRCYREAYCPYLHHDTYVRHKDDYRMQQQGVIGTPENNGFGEGGGITSRTSEELDEANGRNFQSTSSFSVRHRSRSPCRNFLRGRCFRGAHCPYLHHDAHVNPTDDCSTNLHQTAARTLENPGYGGGSEGVSLITLKEHDDVHNDGGMRSSYFRREPRSRSPCRKFLSGRCYRGASCPYLHPVTDDRTQYMGEYSDRDNMGMTSRSWSSERQTSGPFRVLGANKPRPEVCLKYSQGKCTLGESCRYLHSFHEYAKSASDWTKPPHFESAAATCNSSGPRQCNLSMIHQELDSSFDEKMGGRHSSNLEKPNSFNEKDEVVAVNQQKCEISGELIAKNYDISETDGQLKLQHLPFKRRRSRSRSPFSASDDVDVQKMRRHEFQNNFNSRSKSPLTQRENFGCRMTRRDESQDNFPTDRCHGVAHFQYPYAHSHRYTRPRYYVNKEPHSRVTTTSVDHSSYGLNKDPTMMETLRHDKVMSHEEMQLDKLPISSHDSNTAIVNQKSNVEFTENAHQDVGGSVKDSGDLEISIGEIDADALVLGSDSIHTSEENHSYPTDTNVSASNKYNHAEVKTDYSQEGRVNTEEKQALAAHIVESLSRQVPYPSTHGLSSISAGEACSIRQEIMSIASVSENTQDLVTSHPVKEFVQGNGAVIKEIQNNVESALATIEDGTSVTSNTESNSMQMSPASLKAGISCSRRKLLVLDVNGLLADIVSIGDVPRGYKPDMIISMKAVFKRPFCDNFLEFCFGRFDVGVWSSRNQKNVERVIDYLMFNNKKRLLFCWNQAHCTDTGFKTVENRDKPLVLKELTKLWEKQETDLPWDKGFYDETNTVLLDDSPYKALLNPPHTAIFPYAYNFRDAKDKSLGPGNDLRVYLERLADAENVQKFIQENPFGQRPITKSNLSWGFYSKIIGALANHREGSSNSPLATKLGNCASQQERNTGNSTPASKSVGDHDNQQKEYANKSVASWHELQEGNTNKSSTTKDDGARTNQQEGNVGYNLDTESVLACAKEQEESVSITPSCYNYGFHVNHRDGTAEQNPTNQQGGNVDSRQLEGNANSTYSIACIGVQSKENVVNVSEPDSKAVGSTQIEN